MENFAVLCPELAFKIEYYADAAAYQGSVGTECGQLCCCTGSREDGYVLAVNCEWLLEAWQHSALHGLLSSESFTDAFVVSELSVLRYEKTALFTGTEGTGTWSDLRRIFYTDASIEVCLGRSVSISWRVSCLSLASC